MSQDPELIALAQTAVDALRRHGLTLAAAESVTGGAFLTALTAIPGSSEVIEGGAVVYTAEAKRVLAQVSPDLLAEYGTVAPETSQALAHGIRRVLDADIGMAVTGYAGPDPGDALHPRGRCYWHLSSGDREIAQADDFAGDREAVRRAAVRRGLELLIGFLSAGLDQ